MHLTNIFGALTLLLALAGSSLVATVQAATNYYVALNGNDSNPGTQSQPFRTIQYAIGQSKPGDTINVRGGVYQLDKGIWIGNDRSGTANAWLTIQSYPGETAILDGSAMTEERDCIAIGGQFIGIRGFECRNTPRSGLNVWGGSNIRILNNVVHDTRGTGIVASGAVITENGQTRTIRATNVWIEGNRVYRANLNNSGPNKGKVVLGQGITAARADNVTIIANNVYENYGEGIGCFLVTACRIAQNTSYDNFSTNIYFDNVTNSIIERNLAYTTGKPEFFRRLCDTCESWPATGIQMANETYETLNPLDGNIVRNNITVGGNAGFYYGNYDCADKRQADPSRRCGMRNSQIVNNTFYHAEGRLLNIDEDRDTASVTVANNIFVQEPGKQMVDVSPGGGTFTHNLWFGGAAGPAAGSADVNADPQFANPGGSDPNGYKLKAGSPARGAGIARDDVPTDFFGGTRPQNRALDIGAAEFATTTPSPTPPSGTTPAPSPNGRRVWLPLIGR